MDILHAYIHTVCMSGMGEQVCVLLVQRLGDRFWVVFRPTACPPWSCCCVSVLLRGHVIEVWLPVFVFARTRLCLCCGWVDVWALIQHVWDIAARSPAHHSPKSAHALELQCRRAVSAV